MDYKRVLSELEDCGLHEYKPRPYFASRGLTSGYGMQRK